MNCGHSYWSSVELADEELAVVCAFTVLLEFACKVETEAKSDETSSSAKITMTQSLFGIIVCPQLLWLMGGF